MGKTAFRMSTIEHLVTIACMHHKLAGSWEWTEPLPLARRQLEGLQIMLISKSQQFPIDGTLTMVIYNHDITALSSKIFKVATYLAFLAHKLKITT